MSEVKPAPMAVESVKIASPTRSVKLGSIAGIKHNSQMQQMESIQEDPYFKQFAALSKGLVGNDLMVNTPLTGQNQKLGIFN